MNDIKFEFIHDAESKPTEDELIEVIFNTAERSHSMRIAGDIQQAQELDEVLVGITANLLGHPELNGESYEGACACHECQQYSAD